MSLYGIETNRYSLVSASGYSLGTGIQMSIIEFFKNLESKDLAMRKLITQLLSSRQAVSFLVDGLFSLDTRVRYESAGLLNFVAQNDPKALYPHFNSLRDALNSLDLILRIDVSSLIRKIARVDSQSKIEVLLADYGIAPVLTAV